MIQCKWTPIKAKEKSAANLGGSNSAPTAFARSCSLCCECSPPLSSWCASLLSLCVRHRARRRLCGLAPPPQHGGSVPTAMHRRASTATVAEPQLQRRWPALPASPHRGLISTPLCAHRSSAAEPHPTPSRSMPARSSMERSDRPVWRASMTNLKRGSLLCVFSPPSPLLHHRPPLPPLPLLRLQSMRPLPLHLLSCALGVALDSPLHPQSCRGGW